MRTYPLWVFVLGLLVAWAVILAGDNVMRGPTMDYPMLHVFGGILLGTLAMHIFEHEGRVSFLDPRNSSPVTALIVSSSPTSLNSE